jgi:tRNA nucleotidyltransferase/poly(A) polymerase
MLVRRGGFTIEVATFRTDGSYGDKRRPDSVSFTDAKTDARRRDFTINGLFCDPESGELIDYVHGLEDLKAGVIRAIGTPADRFAEDHLRMLRAVRFAALLDFSIHPDTVAAIRSHAGQIDGVSRERIGQELQRMLCDKGALRAMALLADLDLEEVVFGAGANSAYAHLQCAVDASVSWPGVLAALALDRGVSAATIRSQWTPAMVLSNAAREGSCGVLEMLERLSHWDTMTVANRRRCAGEASFDEARLLHGVRASTAAKDIAQTARQWASLAEGTLPNRLLDGHALLQAGVPAGAGLGVLLELVYDGQLDGRVQTAIEALDLLRTLRDSTA